MSRSPQLAATAAAFLCLLAPQARAQDTGSEYQVTVLPPGRPPPSVNCMPRGVPAIWLQNPYGTMLVHKEGLLAQLYEVLNNFRVIYIDDRPLPEYYEPLFHGNSTARWAGDTLVVESIGFDERTYILPNGWFHSDELRVVERYSRPSMNYLIVEVEVHDPQVLEAPWKSAPRRWTLTQSPINEFYCTNNRELEELERLQELESGP